MYTYTKIETIYDRDTEGTKKLIEGQFRNEAVKYLKDLDWIWTEKIDGTNIGVVWDGHKVSFQGRTEKADIQKHLLEKLERIFLTNEMEEILEQLFGEKEVIFFGEGYGNNIQKCGKAYIPDSTSFILFDIYFPGSNVWATRTSLEAIAKSLGIDTVPIIGVGPLNNAVKFVKTHPKSSIGTANMEGLVCKPYVDMYDRNDKRIVVKIKACDF